MSEQSVGEPRKISLPYLVNNPDVISATSNEPTNLAFSIESNDGYKINVELIPFDSVATVQEKQNMELEDGNVSDFFLARKIEFSVGGQKIDLITIAENINAKVLIPKRSSSVIDTSFTQNSETAYKIMARMLTGEKVSEEEILTIQEQRGSTDQNLLRNLSEDEFKYLVRNRVLYKISGAKELKTGEKYIICPIPISDYGIYVFFHEFGHLIDPDNFSEIIKLYGLAQSRVDALNPEERTRILDVERRSDAKAVIFYRNFLKLLSLSNSKKDTLRQAIQLHLYNYYKKLEPNNIFKAVRKGYKSLGEDQLEAITNYE